MEDLRICNTIHIVVNEDAVAQVLGLESVAIFIVGGQGEVEAAEARLVTTVIPLVSAGIIRNTRNDVSNFTEGSITVGELKSGHAQVVAVVGVQTSCIVALGELGIDVALATQHEDLLAVKHELDLGGALVKLSAQVVDGLTSLLVNTILVSVGLTPTEDDTILISFAVGQVLASGDGNHTGSSIIGTLYPAVVAVVPP